MIEAQMKQKGEDRVWKKILSRNGSYKTVVQSQEGQSLIFKDAIKVLPMIRDWIENKTSKIYRKTFQEAFPINQNNEDEPDEFLLQKIVEVSLLLASTTFMWKEKDETKTRHKKIENIQKNILDRLSFENAFQFVEVFVDCSDLFYLSKNVTTEKSLVRTIVQYECILDDKITLQLYQEASMAFFPEPMLTPPVDWEFIDGEIKGGYKTYQYEMIRATKKFLRYENYSQKVFDAINYIQQTPWVVCEEVLKCIIEDLKAPKKEDYVITEFPEADPECQWDVDLKEEGLEISGETIEKIQKARKDYYDVIGIYNAEKRDFESAMGKYRALKMAIGIAERYKGETIYFPHSFDFRGRIYPISIGLSPQGSDAVKAMLTYKEGEVLTKDGEDWAWAYLASLYGEDKLPFEERIALGKELLNTDYHEADEPYQFLSHQLELKEFQKDRNYKFRGRIHLDACNSGSQFTSAITGDIKGCEATNVIPTYVDEKLDRKDAYLLVRDKTIALLQNDLKTAIGEDAKLIQFFIDLLEEDGRKICKRPVMVSNYGGSEGGRIDIIFDMLREKKCQREYVNKKCASVLAQAIGKSIHGVLNGGKMFEKYIQGMNNIIAKNNKPIIWHTDDGFEVVFYKNKELKARRVRCTLPKARRSTLLTIKTYSRDIAPTKMKSAISPNYIHSLDAELLRCTALSMKEAGIEHSDWIHDSFGCLPNHVSLMLQLTKANFKRLMGDNPLKALDKELRGQAGTSKPILKKLDKIKVPSFKDSEEILGELDKSEWFFS